MRSRPEIGSVEAKRSEAYKEPISMPPSLDWRKNALKTVFFKYPKIMFKNIKKHIDIYFCLCLSKGVFEEKSALIYLALNVRTDRSLAGQGFQRIKILYKRS